MLTCCRAGFVHLSRSVAAATATKRNGGRGGGGGGGATRCNQACKHTSQLFRHHTAFSNVHKQPHRHPVGPAPVPVAAAADAR